MVSSKAAMARITANAKLNKQKSITIANKKVKKWQKGRA